MSVMNERYPEQIGFFSSCISNVGAKVIPFLYRLSMTEKQDPYHNCEYQRTSMWQCLC